MKSVRLLSSKKVVNKREGYGACPEVMLTGEKLPKQQLFEKQKKRLD